MSCCIFANTNRVLRVGIFEEYSQGGSGYSDDKMSELANEDPSLYLCLRKPCKKIELYNAIKSLLDHKNV